MKKLNCKKVEGFWRTICFYPLTVLVTGTIVIHQVIASRNLGGSHSATLKDNSENEGKTVYSIEIFHVEFEHTSGVFNITIWIFVFCLGRREPFSGYLCGRFSLAKSWPAWPVLDTFCCFGYWWPFPDNFGVDLPSLLNETPRGFLVFQAF